jgi:hypothetical protein
MISHTEKNGKLYFRFNNELLAVVKKTTLQKFLEGDTLVPKKRPQPTTKKTLESFIKYYLQMKDKFYNKKLPKNITEKSKDYKFFKDGLKLARELEMNPKQYIKAQIRGLSFVDNGRGQFPKPSQLVGDNAMNRALDYLRETSVNEDEIELASWETYRALEDNTKYQTILKRIEKQTATLSEAYYVKKLQEHWNSKASMEVEVYIELMEEDVSS